MDIKKLRKRNTVKKYGKLVVYYMEKWFFIKKGHKKKAYAIE